MHEVIRMCGIQATSGDLGILTGLWKTFPQKGFGKACNLGQGSSVSEPVGQLWKHNVLLL